MQWDSSVPKNDSAKLALMTVEFKESEPNVADAAAKLGVSIDDVDKEFGFVPINAALGLYAVRVRGDRLSKSANTQKSFDGPFADPPIESFKSARSEPKQ